MTRPTWGMGLAAPIIEPPMTRRLRAQLVASVAAERLARRVALKAVLRTDLPLGVCLHLGLRRIDRMWAADFADMTRILAVDGAIG